VGMRLEELTESELSLVRAAVDLIADEHGWVRIELLDAAEAKIEKALVALRFVDDGANNGAMTPTYSEHGLRYILRGIRDRARTVLAELEKPE